MHKSRTLEKKTLTLEKNIVKKSVKPLPVVLCSAKAWVQMEGNAKALLAVVNAQSDD